MVTGSKTCKLQVITPFFGSHLSADVKKKKKRKEKKERKMGVMFLNIKG